MQAGKLRLAVPQEAGSSGNQNKWLGNQNKLL